MKPTAYALAGIALALTASFAAQAVDRPAGPESSMMEAATTTAAGAERNPHLSTSGLSTAAAEKLIRANPSPSAMEGCRWVIRDTPFATDVLLYRALDCDSETKLEVQIGNHMTSIVHASAPEASDDNAPPLVVAQVFAGHPDGRSRALFETRNSLQNPRLAKRCDIRPPYDPEGLPSDALIVDVRRTRADLQRDDAVPECGLFGYNPAGGSIDFWRPYQGYAWFFSMETGVWNVDPASFTLITKSADGTWQRLPDPS